MPVATEELQFIERCLTDTGFCARHLFGYNYDDDEDRPGERANVGTGGIRADGPHREITEFLDDTGKRFKHLEAPRGTYKSTCLISFCARHILRNPNVRILYGMKTAKKAKEKLQGVKQLLESDRVTAIFGDQRGDTWSKDNLSVKGRTVPHMEYTFQIFGVDQPATGGHYDLIILDDLVDWDNVNTKEGIQKVLACFRMVEPLLVDGGTMIIVGTRYADGDLYGHILSDLREDFDILVFGAGVYPTQDKKSGTIVLEGEPVFACLTKEKLYGKLRRMGFVKFCSQYLNMIVSGTSAPFRREQFIPTRWTEQMRDQLTVHILTDTATTEKEENCFSVIAVIGFDPTDRPFLLDLRIGHWLPGQFVDVFFELLAKWDAKGMPVQSQGMEEGTINNVYRSFLEGEAVRRQVRLNLVGIKRSGGESGKHQRIGGLQARFENEGLYVVSTVPSHYVDVQETKVLFNPEGHLNEETGRPMPSGELVDQFIRWPRYPQNDIADCLADIERTDKNGSRLFRHLANRLRSRRRSQGSTRGQLIPLGLTDRGRRFDTSANWLDRTASRVLRDG